MHWLIFSVSSGKILSPLFLFSIPLGSCALVTSIYITISIRCVPTYCVKFTFLNLCSLKCWEIFWNLFSNSISRPRRKKTFRVPDSSPDFQVKIKCSKESGYLKPHVYKVWLYFSFIYNFPKFMEIRADGVLNVNFSHNILYNKVW